MKTPRSFIKGTLFLSVLSLGILSSCKKGENDGPQGPTDPQTTLANLKDSASYTIDGKHYICDISSSFGRGNAGANRDSITGRWVADTLLYYTEFGLTKRQDEDLSDDGAINVVFLKKYAKSQLASYPPITAILRPTNEPAHYTPGKYPLSLDFKRNNRQNGVALTVRKVNGNVVEDLLSFINADYRQTTTITAGSQDNSSFEITRFDPVGDGSYLLEAKFTANVFDWNEAPKRVEKGYLRFRVY